jgi:hypothetical protein
MAKNMAGHSPIDVAAAAGRGEVLNAMLLACAGAVGVWVTVTGSSSGSSLERHSDSISDCRGHRL